MKNLLLVVCLLLTGYAAAAQATKLPLPVDSATQKVSYTGVVSVAGATQSELYARARTWFATEFKSANSVLQLGDKQTGSLIGKGTTEVAFKARMELQLQMRFTLTVKVKEGRYRYELTNLQTRFGGRTQSVEVLLRQKENYKAGQPTPEMLAMTAAIDTEAKTIVARLQQAMTAKPKEF